MNTVNKINIVKTVEAQKEIFLCDIDKSNDLLFFGIIFPFTEKKVDLVVFSDIWEDLNKLPNNPAIKTQFLALRCVVGLMQDGDGDGVISVTTPEDNVPRVESCRYETVLK